MNYSEKANRNKDKNRAKQKKTKKRKRRIGLILFRICLFAAIIGGFAVVGGAVGAYMGIIENTALLNATDVVPESYTSIIYDDKGNEIDKLHRNENREYIKLDDVPKRLQDAIVAIEDERFFDHNGIDLKGIMRAVVVNVKSGSLEQGASTITQQLIKNEEFTNEKTFTRKIKEQYLAITFEKDLQKQLGSKKQAKKYILELYLNSIALGHGLNGVKTASEFYFGKEASELNLAESACIAGITNNPTAYSPILHPEQNKSRQKLVLQKMVDNGYITEREKNEALAYDIYSRIVGQVNSINTSTAQHSYFVDALILQIAADLQEQKQMTSQQAYDMIYSGGLKINATVDMDMQKIMDESYKNDSLFPPRGNTLDADYTISVSDPRTGEQRHINKKETVNTRAEAEAFAESVKQEALRGGYQQVAEKLNVSQSLQSAMVIMDYHNGEVKALIGGRGEKSGDMVFNRATSAKRQPGSVFKPLSAYAPAIDLGLLSAGSLLMDAPLTVNGKNFSNWTKNYKGAVTVRQAIKDSMNIVAVKTLMMVGYDRAFDYLKKMGITTLVEGETRNGAYFSDKGPATALGGVTDGVTVMELTGAYSTIANGGEYNRPALYSYVESHDGEILLDNRNVPSTKVLKESTAFMLTDMMKDVITGDGNATGRLANFPGMTIAGKTGTTTDDKDLTFVGYTPYYCAGIWLGYDNPRKLSYDKSYHLLLWKDIMQKIHKDLPNKDFTAPQTVTKKRICMASGLNPSSACSNDYYGLGATKLDYIDVSSAKGSGTCSLHTNFKMDLASGMIANSYCGSVRTASLPIDGNGKVVGASNDIPFRSGLECTAHNSSNRGANLLGNFVSNGDDDDNNNEPNDDELTDDESNENTGNNIDNAINGVENNNVINTRNPQNNVNNTVINSENNNNSDNNGGNANRNETAAPSGHQSAPQTTVKPVAPPKPTTPEPSAPEPPSVSAPEETNAPPIFVPE